MKSLGLSQGGAGERLHTLDAVRGGVLILGVFFHAALSFIPGQQIWIVADPSRSVELSVLFFVLHIFRMTVFFVLAGFFARLLLERRGVGGFIVNRAMRIGAPLASFWPIVLGVIIAVLVWVAVRANGGVAPEGEPPPPLTVETFPLTHLWFLYVLLIFYAAALVLRGAAWVIDREGALGSRVIDPLMRVAHGLAAPLVLTIVMAAMLFSAPNWFMWFGIPTPDTGLMPNTIALTIYGLTFGFGWLLQRQPDVMRSWAAAWPILAGPALGATCLCLVIVGVTPVLAPAAKDWRTLGYAALYAFACWGWTIALIGFAARHLSGHSPARRYLADASYWIYIVHLPLVLVLHAALAPYAWPWFVKYPLILVVAFALMLASYQLIVRYSFIGAILNGKRKKPARTQRLHNAVGVAD